MTTTQIKDLTDAANELTNRPGDDNSKAHEPEETANVEDTSALAPDDERVMSDTVDIPWKATHYIGNYIVMEKSFVTGLKYWIEENGKRRRPTAERILRPYAPKADPARQMWLDREAFSLALTAYRDTCGGRAEGEFDIAERIDGEHVLLSLYDRPTGSHARYLIQIPDTFEVVGSRVP